MATAHRQFRFLLHYSRNHRLALGLSLVFVLFSTALDQVSPWVIKILIESLEAGQYHKELIPILVALVGVTLISATFLFWQRFLLITASREAEFEIRNDLFKKLQRQGRAFFDVNSIGDIMSRTTNDLEHVRELIGPGVLHAARMVLMFLYGSIALVLISPTLAALGLGLALLLPFASLRYMHRIHARYKQIQEALGRLNQFIQESVSGVQVIKAFGQQQWFQERFAQRSSEFRDTTKKIALSTATIWPVISFISGLGLCATILVGAWMVHKGSLTTGALAATVIYLVRIQFPLVGLGWVASMVQRGRASLDRILELQDLMEQSSGESSEKQAEQDPIVDFEKISLRSLSFCYPGSSKLALDRVNLEIPAGKSLGIVGESGSGKTTLVQILCGIRPAPPGTYFVNNADTNQLPISQWRPYFALAPQDGFLFSETIRSNIEIGKSANSRNSVEECVNLACLDGDLPHIPNGLDAQLGEKGINLSGGQKQRVGLARALHCGAPVLVLDDSLSAVDIETEFRIIKHLQGEFGKLTSVIVAHRYSAVVHCDEIILLSRGIIAERGTHNQLLEQGGLYAANWRTQVLGADLEAM